MFTSLLNYVKYSFWVQHENILNKQKNPELPTNGNRKVK